MLFSPSLFFLRIFDCLIFSNLSVICRSIILRFPQLTSQVFQCFDQFFVSQKNFFYFIILQGGEGLLGHIAIIENFSGCKSPAGHSISNARDSIGSLYKYLYKISTKEGRNVSGWGNAGVTRGLGTVGSTPGLGTVGSTPGLGTVGSTHALTLLVNLQ
jgi:hypothetical protein